MQNVRRAPGGESRQIGPVAGGSGSAVGLDHRGNRKVAGAVKRSPAVNAGCGPWPIRCRP